MIVLVVIKIDFALLKVKYTVIEHLHSFVISDFSMVAKLTREPPKRKTKEGEEKPPSPVSRSAIKQAMRMKCNTVISLQKKTGIST